MAALVNADVVTSRSIGKLSSELGSTELRGAQALGGLRFPLQPLRGKRLRNGSIRSAGENGSASSNGSASRMVPIEEAVKGRSATFLNNRPNGAINGGAKSSTNGATYRKVNTNGSGNGSTNGSASGLARPVVVNRELGGVSIGKVSGSVSTDVVIPNVDVAKRVLQPPVDVAKYEEQPLRVLPSDEGFSWAKEDYSATPRQIDIWSFVLTLRSRVWLLDAKWTLHWRLYRGKAGDTLQAWRDRSGSELGIRRSGWAIGSPLHEIVV